MSKVAVGSFPQKICYTYSDEIEAPVGCTWDINDWYDEDPLKTVKEKVTPAFPTDSEDVKGLATAKQWAERTYREGPEKTAQTTIVDNKPVKNIRVFSLEERNNGGRAYKVLIDKFFVDLREDVLMDTMLKVGISPGGILQGEFVWAKMGAQMKLVRVGSELHRLIVEFESKKDIKPVGKGDLEVGGVYLDRRKNKAIFVGYVNTTVYKKEIKRNRWALERDGVKVDFKFKKSTKKKAMLFYDVYAHEKLAVSVKNMTGEDRNYCYKVKTSHNFIEKIDQVDVKENVIEKLRTMVRTEVKNLVLEYTGHKDPKKNYARIDAYYLEETIEYKSERLNLYKFPEAVDEFDVKTLILFS
ncbi:MAG TPA: hypothetical protein VII94_04360 [Candidatus Saccharimonadales bacterium]